MIAMLPAVTRERLRRFMRIVRMAAVIGAGVGAVYGVAIARTGRSFALRFPADLHTHWCHRRPAHGGVDRRHRDLPAASRFDATARRVAVRCGVHPEDACLRRDRRGAVLAGQPGERLLGVVNVYNARTGLIAVCLSLVAVAVLVMMFQAAGLVGYRTFMALLLGKYRRPHAERRVYLFAFDVVGSTTMARATRGAGGASLPRRGVFGSRRTDRDVPRRNLPICG